MPSNTSKTNGAVRQSPRKRKRDDAELEAIPLPSRHKLKPEDVDSTDGEAVSTVALPSIARKKRAKKDVVLDEPARTDIVNEQSDVDTPNGTSTPRRKKKSTLSQKSAANTTTTPSGGDQSSNTNLSDLKEENGKPKPKRKKKTKEEKEAEAMPLAARTKGLNMFVGAHVSMAKGVENAITNAVHVGGNAFALFLQSQRKWDNPELKPENRDAFIQACSHHEYDQKQHVVPHGSYLVNLAAKGKEQAQKSYDHFLGDLKRCEELKIKYFNFHPGATNKEPLEEAIGRVAANLNRALAETNTVTPLLENMAGTETIIGSRFTDLAQIIAGIKPEYQSRIGICIDTCHAFAAGYDLRTPHAFQKTFEELDEVVGLKYLKAMHINDSKGMFKSKKDLHQNIGLGFLGLRAFHNVMNEPRLANIPLILETPCDRPDPEDPKKTIDDKTVWSREIKLLESLIGMDPESDEFKKLEKDLADQGKEERDKMEKWQAEKEKKEREKDEKTRKKGAKAEKGLQNIAGMLGSKGTKKQKGKSPSPSPSEKSNSDSSELSELSSDSPSS